MLPPDASSSSKFTKLHLRAPGPTGGASSAPSDPQLVWRGRGGREEGREGKIRQGENGKEGEERRRKRGRKGRGGVGTPNVHDGSTLLAVADACEPIRWRIVRATDTRDVNHVMLRAKFSARYSHHTYTCFGAISARERSTMHDAAVAFRACWDKPTHNW